MTRRRTAAVALRAFRSRRTVRLRLTAWYGGLFLLSGAVLLAVTYELVVQAFVGNSAANAVCQAPGTGCQIIGAQQARAIAVQEHASVLGELVSRSALALVLVAVLSVALGWFIAGRALRPVRTITTAARQISAASLSERLALAGPRDELTELADTIDQLLARLEAAFNAQRQFIANAAHELRTPLARQRVISQVALADPGATIQSLRAAHERALASGAQQQQLIDALLTLARGQAGLGKRESFDLADVAGQVLAARQSEIDERHLTLHALLSPAPATGSRRLAERMAANLIDNALRYNLPGGQIKVVTRTSDSRAVVSVANTGPTISVAIDQLFQPFQRLAPDRTSRGGGLGLGLSIVQAIADAHNAVITARPQPEGGLIIEVAFPDPQNGTPAAHAYPNPPAELTIPALTSATATDQADQRPGSRDDKSRHTSADSAAPAEPGQGPGDTQ
jgi:signal transduction histidine kinase